MSESFVTDSAATDVFATPAHDLYRDLSIYSCALVLKVHHKQQPGVFFEAGCNLSARNVFSEISHIEICDISAAASLIRSARFWRFEVGLSLDAGLGLGSVIITTGLFSVSGINNVGCRRVTVVANLAGSIQSS